MARPNKGLSEATERNVSGDSRSGRGTSREVEHTHRPRSVENRVDPLAGFPEPVPLEVLTRRGSES